MRLAPRPRFASPSPSLALLLAAPMLLACGDDGGGDTGGPTTAAASTSEGSTSTGEASTGTTGDASSSSGTVDDTSTTAAASSGDDTAGPPAGDPVYPLPDAGGCPAGTLLVSLPGAEVCAPFCGGPDDACPNAVTGDATPQCIPFAGQGGSGDPCDEVTPCPDDETCSEGACSEIAFYACQLQCDAGQACPMDMACSGISTCGYP